MKRKYSGSKDGSSAKRRRYSVGTGWVSPDAMRAPVGLSKIRPEVKAVAGAVATTASTAGFVGPIAQPAQGVAINQRLGDEIKMLKFEGNIEFTVADATNVVRLVIFQWYMDDVLDIPALSDIFENTTYPWVSVHKLSAKTRRKYKILYDRAVALSTSNSNMQISCNLDLTSCRKTEFTAGATTGKNILYYAIVSDSVAVTHPGYTFSTALYYQDT